jgi:hypothetical protein
VLARDDATRAAALTYILLAQILAVSEQRMGFKGMIRVFEINREDPTKRKHLIVPARVAIATPPPACPS